MKVKNSSTNKRQSLSFGVSILSISYNQEKFIKDTLEGFVNQKTKFPFEVIIGDDGSTDKTQAIIRQYADLYPNIIKPILREKNIGALPNFLDVMGRAKGKYIAICEGDDYWTDPSKLQRQVNFLERHKDYALCFHPVKVHYANHEERDRISPRQRDPRIFTLERLLKANFIQTNSVMYRRRPHTVIPPNIIPDDWYLHVYHAQFGKIGFINRVMSVYRRHPGGMWWQARKDVKQIWQKYGTAHIQLFFEFKKLFSGNKKYQAIIDQSLFNLLERFVEADVEGGTNFLHKTATKFPGTLENFVSDRILRISKLTKEVAELNLQSRRLKDVNREAQTRIHKLETQLHDIKSSKFWKLRNRLAKAAGKDEI